MQGLKGQSLITCDKFPRQTCTGTIPNEGQGAGLLRILGLTKPWQFERIRKLIRAVISLDLNVYFVQSVKTNGRVASRVLSDLIREYVLNLQKLIGGIFSSDNKVLGAVITATDLYELVTMQTPQGVLPAISITLKLKTPEICGGSHCHGFFEQILLQKSVTQSRYRATTIVTYQVRVTSHQPPPNTTDMLTGRLPVGYLRVSTDEQDLNHQRAELRAAHCTKIFAEKFTGTHDKRAELPRTLEQFRFRNLMIMTQLDRLSSQGTPEISDIIIVDGGSRDGSLGPDAIQKVNVQGLVVETRAEKISAQLRCAYAFTFGLDEGCERIVTIEGNDKDGQEVISRFIAALKEGVDFVQATCFVVGGVAESTPKSRDFAIQFIMRTV